MNAKEIRKQKCFERLGSNHPVCIICGEADWRCLEEHHIAGRAYGDDLAIICRNCHRKLSDDQKDHPKTISSKPTQLESLCHLLLGRADLFDQLAKSDREIALVLIKAEQEATNDHEENKHAP